MALTESQRNQIARYKIQIEGLRRDLQRLKDQKKQKSDYYSNLIKRTKDASQKRSYRQSKISAVNSIVNQIESKKKSIDRVKDSIASIKR
jgi:hypothetical protein